MKLNHSFNRKQLGVPTFWSLFSYAPNADVPRCFG